MLRLNRIKIISIVLVSTLSAVFGLSVTISKIYAISGTSWNAGQIIDDSIFRNAQSMDATAIQNFLNSKVPNCDRNHTGFTGRSGTVYSPPWTCLKEYNENPTTKENNMGRFNADGTPYQVAGGLSAAQIIYQTSQTYSINPQSLLVLLEKEQGIITDTWPVSYQYRSATGYGCPDTSACDSAYYGFYNQVNNAARQFKLYRDNPNSYRNRPYTTKSIYYNPGPFNNATNTYFGRFGTTADIEYCGNSAVYIANAATAGLYNYTPYQPNQAALTNLYGSGDSCSSYGNRNFWRLFNDWFGTTVGTAKFGYTLISQEYFSDSNYTNKITGNLEIEPNSDIYVRVKIRNDGNQTLYNYVTNIGTKNYYDRGSIFANDTWLSPGRPNSLQESYIQSGDVGTFNFKMTTPKDLGTYNEDFGILIEGNRWMDGTISIPITVKSVNPYYSAKMLSISAYSDKEMLKKIDIGNVVKYTGSTWYIKAVVQNTGNQVWPKDLTKIGTTNPLDRQSVFATKSWLSTTRPASTIERDILPQNSATFIFSMSTSTPTSPIQEQFGLVIEGQRWINTNLFTTKVQINKRPSSSLLPGQDLKIGEMILSDDDRFMLILQGDGNLVLYSPTKPLWASQTVDKGGARLINQGDGNLVLYRSDMVPVWNSRTSGKGASILINQIDGNLVLYSLGTKPTWATWTVQK